jgi:ParB-like chromosome segregation protein Spo0J
MSDIVCPARHAWAILEEIEFSDKGRPYQPHEVLALKESIAAIGLQTPLTVVERRGRLVLVAGRHRLEALPLFEAEMVPVRIVDFDDAEARLWQISENLHRNELKVMQRSEHVAEWIRLTDERRQSAQLEPKGPIGHRPPSGINAASRELGIDRNEVQRSARIAALPAEVKQAAIKHGLADNQSALLEAAKQPTPETQIAAIEHRAERKPAHDLASPATIPPVGEIVRPLRNLVSISAGEFARWIKITTPNDRPHVVKVLRMAADLLEIEESGEIVEQTRGAKVIAFKKRRRKNSKRKRGAPEPSRC